VCVCVCACVRAGGRACVCVCLSCASAHVRLCAPVCRLLRSFSVCNFAHSCSFFRYCVENQCSFDSVRFHQLGHEPEASQLLRPFQSKMFTWDDPFAPHKLVVRLERYWWEPAPDDGEKEQEEQQQVQQAQQEQQQEEENRGGGGGAAAAAPASGGGTTRRRRRGQEAAAAASIIDPEWRPVRDALAVPQAGPFIHAVEVVVDLKAMTWTVPDSTVVFPLGGPNEREQPVRLARKMDGPVVVLIVTDLPLMLDHVGTIGRVDNYVGVWVGEIERASD
jgi:hypothetical protein